MGFFDYERILLNAALRSRPPATGRALDVGCGDGRFARRMSACGLMVDAIDRVDRGVVSPRDSADDSVRFIHADFMKFPILAESYSFVSAIASLHHLPFIDAIEKMKRALMPGGELGVVGLFRDATLADFFCSAAAWPLARLRPRRDAAMQLATPTMTLAEIRATAARILPNARIERSPRLALRPESGAPTNQNLCGEVLGEGA